MTLLNLKQAAIDKKMHIFSMKTWKLVVMFLFL